MLKKLIFVFGLLTKSLDACFCLPLMSTCGCSSGGGGYQNYGYSNGAQQGYAVFYRDLTPFRQPAGYQSYRPAAPSQSSQYLPPMYPLPNPKYIRPYNARPYYPPAQTAPQQGFVQKQSPPAPPPPQDYTPQQNSAESPVLVPKNYNQPPAQVEPLRHYTYTATEAPRVAIHDNEYTPDNIPATVMSDASITTTFAPAASEYDQQQSTMVDEDVPEVENTAVAQSSTQTKKTDEFYYAYYDDNGKKVGDSRSGSTFAPSQIIDDVTAPPAQVYRTTIAPRKALFDEVNDSKSSKERDVEEQSATIQIPDETQAQPKEEDEDSIIAESVLTSTTEKPGDVVYEDDVEYQDDSKEVSVKNDLKRGLKEPNQIFVNAAPENSESANEIGYKRIAAARGVKIVQKKINGRSLHSN